MLGDMGIAPQRTLRSAIGCRGIGLHSRPAGRDDVAPGGAGHRDRVSADSTPAPKSARRWSNTIESAAVDVLSNGEGIEVGTVEHLMAALAGAAIDNAIVELDGPEVPIMDGSAAPFLSLIECAGIVEQDARAPRHQGPEAGQRQSRGARRRRCCPSTASR